MFELFLFINPLGLSCYQLEKRIRLLAAKLQLEISVNYIPLVTMEAMKADMVKRNWNFNTSINLANYHNASVSAQRFYYAVQIAYGKKKARSFLFKLQESLSDGQQSYSPALAEGLLESLNVKPEKISSTLNDACLKDVIAQDQQLARKFQVTALPSTVVFDDQIEGSGLLIDGELSDDDLLQIFQNSADCCFEPLMQLTENAPLYYPVSHLHLL